jgi:hypothetical protein
LRKYCASSWLNSSFFKNYEATESTFHPGSIQGIHPFKEFLFFNGSVVVFFRLQPARKKEGQQKDAPQAVADLHPPFLDSLSQRTFHFFWDLANPDNGNVPDRWPTESFSSIAATGFGLTCYLIGVERGYITREQAADRVLRTLKFFWNSPKGGAKPDNWFSRLLLSFHRPGDRHSV